MRFPLLLCTSTIEVFAVAQIEKHRIVFPQSPPSFLPVIILSSFLVTCSKSLCSSLALSQDAKPPFCPFGHLLQKHVSETFWQLKSYYSCNLLDFFLNHFLFIMPRHQKYLCFLKDKIFVDEMSSHILLSWRDIFMYLKLCISVHMRVFWCGNNRCYIICPSELSVLLPTHLTSV